MIIAVEAVVVKNDRYLLIKRSLTEEHAPGTYSLPGGKVELESIGLDVLEKNLIREVYEETSISVDINSLSYLESKSFYTDDNREVIDIVFTCTCEDDTIYSFDEEEVSDVLWLTYEEIMKMQEPTMPFYVKETIGRLQVA